MAKRAWECFQRNWREQTNEYLMNDSHMTSTIFCFVSRDFFAVYIAEEQKKLMNFSWTFFIGFRQTH